MSRPIFIVFEGIDGAGTSTQAALLRDRFLAQNQRAVTTSEPSDGPIGNMIRQALKGRLRFSEDAPAFDAQLAYLFAADRHDHLHNSVDGVMKLLADGAHVISTRYYFSSLAYHCDTEDEHRFVSMLNERFPNPDVVIYLDNPVERSMERLSTRSYLDSYENEAKLRRVSENYNRIFASYTSPLLRLDATMPVAALHDKIFDYIGGFLK